MSYPSIVTAADFQGLSMRQLVEWFNENCAEHERVKSFRTLAMGVTRCTVLMQRIDDQIAFEEETDHLSDEEFQELMIRQLHESNESSATSSVKKAIAEATMPGDDEIRASGLIKPGTKIRAKAYSNSEGVSASWKYVDTKRKRVTRNHVNVTYSGKTEEFGSVRKAFTALGLPDSKHIRFRGKLKASGKEVFEFNGEDFIFEIISSGSDSDD